MIGRVETFDESFSKSGNDKNVTTLLYDRLMERNEDDEYDPWLATEMIPNEEGTEVEVTLRDDVYFHSGDKMTAEDVEFSLAHCLHGTTGSYLAEFTNIEIIDDYHFKWYFPDEDFSFWALYEDAYGLPIINKSYYEEKFGGEPSQDFGFEVDGTGPYVIESFEAASQNITLKKFDNYWGDIGFFDKIILIYGVGDTAMAFEAGEIDFTLISPNIMDQMAEYDNVNVEVRYSDAVNFLTLNCAEGHPTSDIRVREAVHYAFDREEVGMVTCDNSGLVAWNMLYPTVQYYADIQPHRTLDLAKAQSLMKEAGYSESNRCPIKFLSTDQERYLAAAQVLKENLEQCYFDVTIAETTDFMPYFTGDFDIGIIGIGLGRAFQTFSMLFDPETGVNLCYYGGGDLQDIIDAFNGANDQESANKAVMLMDATLGYVPLAYDAQVFVLDDQIDTSLIISGDSYTFSKLRWK
jgi:peptide/nickel transport system substrate-binding protein